MSLVKDYEYETGIVMPVGVQIKNFLNAKAPLSVSHNLKWLTMRVLEREMRLENYIWLIKEKGLSWDLVLEYCKKFQGFKTTAIRFFYITNFRQRIPWAVTPAELFNDLNNNRGKEIDLKTDDVFRAFEQITGGYTWGNILGGVLGSRYIPGVSSDKKWKKIIGTLRNKEVPIYIDIKELLLRVLLMGNDANVASIRYIKQLYKGEKVGANVMPYAATEWFIKKWSKITGLKPSLKAAVKLFLDEKIKEKWKKFTEQ